MAPGPAVFGWWQGRHVWAHLPASNSAAIKRPRGDCDMFTTEQAYTVKIVQATAAAAADVLSQLGAGSN